MTPKELAARLDGRTYGRETCPNDEEDARAFGLVIVFGYSDDNVELRGAIRDEVGSYGGTTLYLNDKGMLRNECGDEDCPAFHSLKGAAATIEAKWDEDGYSWTYETAIPHATFEIIDEGEKYCRGIVFALADVAGGNKYAAEGVSQCEVSAIQLAELVLMMNMGTDKGLVARRLAREVLGLDDHGGAPDLVPIVTNGTLRMIPRDEPVFLVRGQDVVGAATVRALADMASDVGAAPEIIRTAREHAAKMEAWPKKKTPDVKGGAQ